MTFPLPALAGLAAAVVIVWALLAYTDSASRRARHPGLRRFAVLAWFCVLSVGWAAVAVAVLRTPGGAEGAWAWVSAQADATRIAMWLFLLPWMGALWIAQTEWAAWVRLGLFTGLALLTFALAFRLRGDGESRD